MTNIKRIAFIEKAITEISYLAQEACSEDYPEIERMLDRWVIVLASLQAKDMESRVKLMKYHRQRAAEEASLLDDII